MYKKFYQHVDGTGKGRAFAKRIIDYKGGKIENESKLGQGFTFKIYYKKQIY